jgi:hypothetical protein
MIMNADIGELLREGIDRLTGGATAPVGLASRARRRHRQRQLALRTTWASGTTLVAAAAVLIAVAGTAGNPRGQRNIPPGASSVTQPPGGGLSEQPAAYVINRMTRALAAAQHGNAIQEIHTVTHDAWFGLVTRFLPRGVLPPQTSPPVRAGLDPGLFTQHLTTWVYRGQIRWEGLTGAGAVLFDTRKITVNSHRGAPPGMFTQTIKNAGANYQAGTRWSNVYRPSGYFGYGRLPSSCRLLGGGLEPPVPVQYDPYDWSAAVRLSLRCGGYGLAGRQWVDGVKAIKLVTKPQTGPFAKNRVPVLETLWVDPSTYLPVRLLWQWPQAHGQPDGTLVSDFRWLAPTKANLAALRVKIPHGFRQVTLAPGLPQFEFEISGQSS